MSHHNSLSWFPFANRRFPLLLHVPSQMSERSLPVLLTKNAATRTSVIIAPLSGRLLQNSKMRVVFALQSTVQIIVITKVITVSKAGGRSLWRLGGFS